MTNERTKSVRAVSRDHLAAREAAPVLAPFRERAGERQVLMARLRGMLAASQTYRGRGANSKLQLQKMAEESASDLALLEAATSGFAPNSRIDDVRHSLEQLRAQARELAAKLEGGETPEA